MNRPRPRDRDGAGCYHTRITRRSSRRRATRRQQVHIILYIFIPAPRLGQVTFMTPRGNWDLGRAPALRAFKSYFDPADYHTASKKRSRTDTRRTRDGDVTAGWRKLTIPKRRRRASRVVYEYAESVWNPIRIARRRRDAIAEYRARSPTV